MAVGPVTEEVVEQAARRIDGRVVGSLWIGLGIGAAVGFYFGYRYNKNKLRAEIFEEADKEIQEIRERYLQKTIAAENQERKSGKVEEIVRERGYAPPEEQGHFLRPPVPINPARPIRTETKHAFRATAAGKDKMEGWDYETELERRANRSDPYIIHQDEFELNESGYSQASYVYFSGDDVLVDEDDTQSILDNRENLIGEEALGLFGHGADDYNLVHVRNPQLELDIVINRVRGSWEEEVAGLQNDELS